MKTIQHIFRSTLVSLLLMGLPAKAALIQGTDPRFGPNSLTIDTSTGLRWLNLTASAGLSYRQTLADTQPGGLYSGFRFATAQEVLTLYSSAGIPGVGYHPLSSPSILSLISLVGPTGLFNGQPEIIGNSATSESPGTQVAPAIYATGTINGLVWWVDGVDGGTTSYGQTYGFPELGNWLVTTVPESSVASICVLGALTLFGSKYLQRHRKCRLT